MKDKINIDLDKTNFEYYVGEVELITYDKKLIEKTELKLKEFLNTFLGEKNPKKPASKIQMSILNEDEKLHDQLVVLKVFGPL